MREVVLREVVLREVLLREVATFREGVVAHNEASAVIEVIFKCAPHTVYHWDNFGDDLRTSSGGSGVKYGSPAAWGIRVGLRVGIAHGCPRPGGAAGRLKAVRWSRHGVMRRVIPVIPDPYIYDYFIYNLHEEDGLRGRPGSRITRLPARRPSPIMALREERRQHSHRRPGS